MHRDIERYSRIRAPISSCPLKNESFQFCGSRPEQKILPGLAFNHAVLAYPTQPEPSSYQLHGLTRRSTPDLLINNGDGRYGEAKSPDNASDPAFRKNAYLMRLFKYRLQGPPVLQISVQAGLVSIHPLCRYLGYSPNAACLEPLSRHAKSG